MDNDTVNLPRRSVSLGGGGKYRTEDIKQIIAQSRKHTELLMYYIDHIRNYKELSENMMENVKQFDDNSKMKLIQEYNNVIVAITELLG